ncbi:MAG: mannitol-1-phosphate 5-dehydrogenase [Tissierella sp.]|nr:mannitol-1-phosphate 5-dehydrogenase [Tissierella sp.]
MKALIFGAGNIGRGFIGQILNENNYDLIFADISDELIEEINLKKEYRVFFASEEKVYTTISDIRGVHNIKEVKKLNEVIQEVDLIATAVGPSVVPIIARTILEGVKERLRKENIRPFNIIACENAIGATDLLKESLLSNLSEEEKIKAEEYIGFPNSAVDRIVPIQSNEDLLDVVVEPYYEWIIEGDKLKGDFDYIKGVGYKKDLKPYIERKLFTVNTGHASTAYIGNIYGYKTIYEAINDDRVLEMTLGVLAETSEYLVKSFHFSESEQKKYVDTIIYRFKNPHISDDISRVARSPIRKISPNDRFIYPSTQLLKMGKTPHNLAKTISYILKYLNMEDKESIELNEYLKEYGVSKTLNKYSGIEENSTLTKLIEGYYMIKKL